MVNPLMRSPFFKDIKFFNFYIDNFNPDVIIYYDYHKLSQMWG